MIERDGRNGSNKLFSCFRERLDAQGLVAKEGCIIDTKSKLIDSYTTTPASVHDSQVFEELLDEKDKAILSDSAYKSQVNEEVLLKHNLEDFTMLKANRNSPLSDDDKIYNKKVSRIRVRVEHVFGRMKYMAADMFRRIGIQRASQHNALCNLTYNMDRYAFLQR